MQRKQSYPLDWYYSPLWSHKHVFAAGILTFLWWIWLFPLFFFIVKDVFPNFLPFTICMFGMWLLAMLVVFGLWKGRLKPDEIDEDYYLHLLEQAKKKQQQQQQNTPNINVEGSSSSSPTVSVANTPALYNARKGRDSSDFEHSTAADFLAEKETSEDAEGVEMTEGHLTSSSSSSSSSNSSHEDVLQQTELSVDDESDFVPPQDKSLTPRQMFFSDLLRHSAEPIPRDRRSYYMGRPQLTLAEKRKSMPLYLYIGETRTLSYTDQEAVTEDGRKILSMSDSDKYSLSSPAQHVTSDELRSNMSRLNDEQAETHRQKHSSSSSGAEYFIANVSQQKSVTSEVYITIDEPQVSVRSGEGARLVAVTDGQKVISADNDDALSDCVFLDEVSTGT